MGPLYTFDNKKLMHFFQKRGIEFRKARSGKIFPQSNKAADILNILLDECQKRKIKIKYNSPVKKVIKKMVFLKLKPKIKLIKVNIF